MAVPFGKERVYVCANDGGGIGYRNAAGKSIGSFKAFFMGLPSVWSRYTLVALWCGLALAALWPLLVRLSVGFCYKLHLAPQPVRVTTRPRYPLGTRCISLLMVFMFLIGPSEFQTIANADISYINLTRETWATPGKIITYGYTDTLQVDHPGYDANGSVILKTTWTGSVNGTKDEELRYEYNLQNRLAAVFDTNQTPDNINDDELQVEYTYSDSGIRTSKTEYTSGTPQNTTLYLTDPANHTGYAQTIAELTFAGADPVPAEDPTTAIRSYVIGDDILAQNDDPINEASPKQEKGTGYFFAGKSGA